MPALAVMMLFLCCPVRLQGVLRSDHALLCIILQPQLEQIQCTCMCPGCPKGCGMCGTPPTPCPCESHGEGKSQSPLRIHWTGSQMCQIGTQKSRVESKRVASVQGKQRSTAPGGYMDTQSTEKHAAARIYVPHLAWGQAER